ncbi:Helix-turn-helix domain protein [anaerobic digester metagenome]
MGSVGERIREIRIQKKYTQRKLAQLCGISNTYISDMENGRTKISSWEYGRNEAVKDYKRSCSDI